LEGVDEDTRPRIVLLAKTFTIEVTATVLWLIESYMLACHRRGRRGAVAHVEVDQIVERQRRAVGGVAQRLQVLPRSRRVALELDDDDVAGYVESEDVRPLPGLVEAIELRRDDQQLLAEDVRPRGDPLLDLLHLEHAEIGEGLRRNRLRHRRQRCGRHLE
jgi:hypothetical protein